MKDVSVLASENLERLRNSDYPGRGIVLGVTPSGDGLVQLYWTMGRSANSKNRVMAKDGDSVKTLPHDRSLVVEHEDLIIYNAALQAGNSHIVSNGRQTDAIAAGLAGGGSFPEALSQWEYENDAPIYTPRISGCSTAGEVPGYQLSIIKALEQNPALLSRQFFSYRGGLPGFGHCIHTYSLTETCAPFGGEPYWVPVFDSIGENMGFYWDVLPEDKRVALYVKRVDIRSGGAEDAIRNIH